MCCLPTPCGSLLLAASVIGAASRCFAVSLASSGAAHTGALRAIGLAHRDIPSAEAVDAGSVRAEDVEQGLILDALVGIKDPLRPDVAEAVALCQSAGE